MEFLKSNLLKIQVDPWITCSTSLADEFLDFEGGVRGFFLVRLKSPLNWRLRRDDGKLTVKWQYVVGFPINIWKMASTCFAYMSITGIISII